MIVHPEGCVNGIGVGPRGCISQISHSDFPHFRERGLAGRSPTSIEGQDLFRTFQSFSEHFSSKRTTDLKKKNADP